MISIAGKKQGKCDKQAAERTPRLDAVVVVHAAGVQRVARCLAGAAAVEDAAVLAVAQERRRCADQPSNALSLITRTKLGN